jgi:hypothetical protein
MARPIESTPIIKGEDAKKFIDELKNSFAQNSSVAEQEARTKEMEDMRESYDLLESISCGTFY